jgi:Flp pilus assembly protein CpaB
MLGTVSYPQEDMVEGLFFTDLMDVVGKRAKYDLDPGTPLTPSLLSEGATGSFISFEIPQGMVAITIPMSGPRYAISYALKPGDHVDILGGLRMVDLDQEFQTALPNEIATIYKNVVYELGEGGPTSLPVDYTLRVDGSNYLGRIYQDPSIPDEFFYIVPGEGQRPRWITQSVVQNAIVLWVGDLPWEEEAAAPTPTPVPAEGEAVAPVVVPAPERITVAVWPQDAVSINYLMLSEANINFVLRSAGDEQLVQTEAVTLQFIMDQYNIPYPSKLPYGLQMTDKVEALPQAQP